MMRTEILYGYHPVTETIQADRRDINQIYIAKTKPTKRFEEIEILSAEKSIPVRRVSASRLFSLAQTESHQGICAECSPYICVDLIDILPRADNRDACVLLLDQIVDPHNLGALIRTAYCAGLDGVVITKDRSAQPSPAVSRTSAGALEHVLLARVTNMADSIKKLKEFGLWIIGMDKQADANIFSSDLTGPLALVIGGEQKGIRPLVKKHCDGLITIPQVGKIDSLNASVAGGVVIYEALRQRMYT